MFLRAESKSPEVGKKKTNFSCRERNFSFRGLTGVSQGLKVVQPRPEAEAGHSDRG